MKERIEKLGTWWIVQVRIGDSWWSVSWSLSCQNPRHAGRCGRARRRRRNGTLVRRQWSLANKSLDRRFNFAYQFADPKDARQSSKCAAIKKRRRTRGNEVRPLIVEIVKVKGCLNTGTVLSETVIERHFDEGFNEMEQLAIEFSLGEVLYEHPLGEKLLRRREPKQNMSGLGVRR